jgi:DNA mismatch repair ATPase MutS
VHAPALQSVAEQLGEIDLVLSKVRFAQRHRGCVPQFDGCTALHFEEARFLPLMVDLEREGRSYVPISLDIEGVAVLSGPNMGGKSVALRTCGFLVLCASLGLPVPAASARLMLFRQICWLGTGIHEESGGLLSAFAKEVIRLQEMLSAKLEPGLILIDEFARTTNPREGRALLLGLVEVLRRRSVCALIATHLAGIAESAKVPHFAVRGLGQLPADTSPKRLADALRLLASCMDYTITQVSEDAAPAADAIALAQMLGMDDEFIAEARKAL